MGNGRPVPAWETAAGAQLWRRKQTIPKSANIIPGCGMHGSRHTRLRDAWIASRKDVSPSTFLT
jgi:hypothetical protein